MRCSLICYVSLYVSLLLYCCFFYSNLFHKLALILFVRIGTLRWRKKGIFPGIVVLTITNLRQLFASGLPAESHFPEVMQKQERLSENPKMKNAYCDARCDLQDLLMWGVINPVTE